VTYQWNRLSFDLPERIDDETVLLFTDQRDPPRFSITVTEDALGSGASLSAYADGALGELKGDVDAYEQLGRKDRKVGKKGDLAAIEVEHNVTLGGASSWQIQIYVAIDGGVAVFTATASDEGMIDARQALEALASSFSAS
jgi:hypothetical protein